MTQDPTVLFCVGATKAGTSWVYRYLSSHPDCHLRSVKELHYFDARDRDDTKWQSGRFRRNQRELSVAPITDAQQRKIDDYEELIGLLQNEAEDIPGYLAYLNRGRVDERVVADVTPAYSLLSVDRFRKMAGIVANTRFIYVLRDPVSRLWSHIRMKAGNRQGPSGTVQEWANRIFWRMERGRNEGILDRGDYRQVLNNLWSALDPRQLLVLFYEDLFSGATTDKICAFLGIRSHQANFALAVNRGPQLDMTDEQYFVARAWHSEQYDYVSQHFDAVPAAWQIDKTRVKA